MPRCHIALGGNLGDVEETFHWALARLGGTDPSTVTRVSSVFRTRPVGPHAGGEFTNAAAEIETDLEPLALLDLLQDLERRAGRTPGEHWGPRPLDLDLIFYADQMIDMPRLRVPHPACWYRRFRSRSSCRDRRRRSSSGQRTDGRRTAFTAPAPSAAIGPGRLDARRSDNVCGATFDDDGGRRDRRLATRCSPGRANRRSSRGWVHDPPSSDEAARRLPIVATRSAPGRVDGGRPRRVFASRPRKRPWADVESARRRSGTRLSRDDDQPLCLRVVRRARREFHKAKRR